MFSKPLIAATTGAALAAVTLGVAGCGTRGDHASVTGTRTTAPPTSAAGSATASPSSGAGVRTSPACGTATLRASLTLGGAAAGSRFATLVLTNTGGAPCHTYGYPGLKLTGTGNPPTKADRVTDTGKPVHVDLAPGTSAWTRLQWAAAPGAGDHQTGACQPTATALWITPPDQRAHLTATWSYGPVCDSGTIHVNPFHPGDHDPGAA